MANALLIVIDNSYSSQNQDYAPNRYLAQKAVVDALTGEMLRAHPENEVGIVELAQQYYQIMTPTRDRNALNMYLSAIDLDYKKNTRAVFIHCFKALENRTHHDKTFLVFIGSVLDSEFGNELKMVKEMLNLEYSVKIVFFGEGIMYSERFEDELSNKNYSYAVIGGEDDFYASVMDLFGNSGSMEEDDPELAYALQASLREQ